MQDYARDELYARAFKFIIHEAEWNPAEIDTKFIFTFINFVNFYIEEEKEASKR